MLIATKLYLSHLKKIPIALITGGVAIYSGLAAAQQSPVDEIEEVIVSADFRHTQLMQSTGSISVLVEQTIQERASQHLESILNTVPNVTWSAGGSRSRFIQMRGIGDLEQFSDPKYYPSVGIMLDDLELGDSASAGMLFDTEQVEVLRGPQGVRFGASAHAGMVNIKTKAPTDSFEGSISGGVGNYDSYNLGAAISGPLSDQLKGRLAIQQNTGDGYIENKQLAKDNTNGFDELTARAKLQWSPSASSQYDIGVFYFDSDNGYDVWSLDNERITYSDQPGKDKQETLAVTAKGEWVLNSEQTLQAVLTHTDSDLLWSYDGDFIGNVFCVVYECTNDKIISDAYDREREKLTLDIKLLGGDELLSAGESRYVLGLYGNKSDEILVNRYLSESWDSYLRSDYGIKRYAIYGEYEYAKSEKLTLVAGLRFENFADNYKSNKTPKDENSDDLWSGELSLRYQFDNDTMMYATIARSKKPEGVNTYAMTTSLSPWFERVGKSAFNTETLLNKEIGLKANRLDGRLDIRAALFYTGRENAQLESWIYDDDEGWVGYLDSAADATNYGIEIEAGYKINNRWQLFASAGWLETEVDSLEVLDPNQEGEANKVYRDRRDQAKSPNYQYNVGTRVNITQNLSARVEIEGQGDSYYGYYHNGKLDSYNLVNASANWTQGDISISIWARNLQDKEYSVHGLYFAPDPRQEGVNKTYLQYGEPRTFGVNMTLAF